eukprot:TRINITY_DN1066_c0_g1_i7.p1 TRINITY_DN1066_c0_g1~~TRINITY_DN1066_c0_g1_i7.p1  ORF type:complete len:157 (-),score=37.59 TRINITY_DN1066_c0_g1_i7:116-586(-)
MQLNTENNYFRSISRTREFKNPVTTKKLKKVKSMGRIESDSESEVLHEHILSTAVKLLTIKYNFERKKDDWKGRKSKRKRKAQGDKGGVNGKPGKQYALVERKKPPEKKIEEQEIEEIIVDFGNANKSDDIVPNKEEDVDEVNLEYQKRLSSYSLT